MPNNTVQQPFCDDVNECTCMVADDGSGQCQGSSTLAHNCQADIGQLCSNQVGSFRCVCRTGTFFDESARRCEGTGIMSLAAGLALPGYPMAYRTNHTLHTQPHTY